MSGRILLPVAVLTIVLAFLAAGCGGGQSAEEKWANDVCTPINDWNTQIRQLINDAKSAVSSPDATTIDRLKTDAQKARDATDKLKSDLQSLPPAPGANGETARQNFTSFADQVSKTVDQLKTAVNNLSSSSNLSQAATVLAGAAGQLSTFSTQAKSAVSSAQETSSKLRSGFDKADSCKDLRS
jgi:methyl-accepting chemotaxis protein